MDLTIFLFCYLVYIILGFWATIYRSICNMTKGIGKKNNRAIFIASVLVVVVVLIFGPFANPSSFLGRK